MYNIVRISSKKCIPDSSQATDVSSASDHINFSEPLLSGEDNVDKCTLPCTVSKGDPQVVVYLTIFS